MSPISNHLLSCLKTTIQWRPRHQDKSTGREEKGGKLKWESCSSSSCGEANFVLLGSSRASTWTWMDNVHALHLLLPLLTQLIFPVRILEDRLDWLLLHRGQQVITLFLQHEPVCLCLLRDSCRKKGGLWEGKPPVTVILIASSALQNTNPACWASLKSTTPQQLSEEAIWSEIRFAAFRQRCSYSVWGFGNCLDSLECFGFNWDSLLCTVILLIV